MKWNVVGHTFSNQLSTCVNIANSPNGFVTRMGLLAESLENPAKVMFVAVSVWCCCAQFVRATDQFDVVRWVVNGLLMFFFLGR